MIWKRTSARSAAPPGLNEKAVPAPTGNGSFQSRSPIMNNTTHHRPAIAIERNGFVLAICDNAAHARAILRETRTW